MQLNPFVTFAVGALPVAFVSLLAVNDVPPTATTEDCLLSWWSREDATYTIRAFQAFYPEAAVEDIEITSCGPDRFELTNGTDSLSSSRIYHAWSLLHPLSQGYNGKDFIQVVVPTEGRHIVNFDEAGEVNGIWE